MGHRSENINVSIDRVDNRNKFGLSVDVVIVGYDHSEIKILAIECDMAPYRGLPSLLGDLISQDERLDKAASRILKKHTGLEDIYLKQLGAFDGPNRHPVDRVISIGYFSLINVADCDLRPTPSGKARWMPFSELEKMAFDHRQILESSMQKIRNNIDKTLLTFNLLPSQFTLTELQRLQELLLGKTLDKRNFRKRVINMGLIEPTGQYQSNVSHRPAKLYRLARVTTG